MAPGRRAVVLFAMLALAVAVAAVWLAPAALLDLRMAGATGGVVRLAQADGTVWNGRGSVVAGATRIPIAWRVECWPLLRGVLRVRSGLGHRRRNATRDHRRRHATTSRFHDVDVTVPAEVIATALGPIAVVSVAGEVSLKADDIEWTSDSSRGEARVLWHAARIAHAGSAVPLDLGDVRTLMTADGNVLSGPLTNEGGDLVLRGVWTMRARDSAQLALHLTPRRPGPSDLARTLAAIGTADGNGWRIDWRAPLR